MATSQASQDNPLAGFGPNEWIVEEMYQRYLADPASVDSAWHEFFADYRPNHDAGVKAPPGPQTTTTPPSSTPPPPAGTPAGDGAAPARPAPAPDKAAPATPARAAAPKTAPAVARPAAAAKPAPAKEPSDKAATPQPLRGAAARIVQNMDRSLTVPTATSVRAVPAKLIADNRVVLNNHLERSRGGKISFTHLIGYALVKAVMQHPEMNTSYTTVDGKPAVVTPEHINLGLAIDLPRPDGSRMLVVPSIKACEQMDFRQFWQAYEDVVRRARRGELTMDD